MLSIGKMNTLTVESIDDSGAYLSSDEGKILLPSKYQSGTLQAGDEIDVFVYKDIGDQLMATTTKPHAVVGDIAMLEVVDVNDIGAFLAWGMEKDLLLPYRRQIKQVRPGQKCIVKLFLDEKSGRVVASSKLRPFLKMNDGSLKAGDEMTAVFFDITDVGFSAVLNDKYIALLHKPDATEHIELGEPYTVYIRRVLSEGQIELSLTKVGYQGVIESRLKLVAALKDAGGFMPYTDKSSPEEIQDNFNMSKKAFKRVVGTLYKEKKLKLEDDGIRLI